MRAPLLLLAAPSRESNDKAEHFAAAAEALDVPARILVAQTPEQIMIMAAREPYRYALACSDAFAAPAAALNERARQSACGAALTAALVDKGRGIPMLSVLLDLPMLPQCVPLTPDDLLAWPYAGPLIAKPTRSAGGWSPRPWGYRRFESARGFLDWLAAESLTADFFAEQQRPGQLGPVLMQAAIDNDHVEVASLLLASAGATVICRGYGLFQPHDEAGHGRHWIRALYHADAAPDLAERLPRLAGLIGQAPGWGHGVLHVQGIRAETGFYLTDINLRISTAWDWLMGVADPSFHRRLLASLLFGESFDPAWPAPAMAIDLVYGLPDRGRTELRFPPPGESILPWRMQVEAGDHRRDGFDRAGQVPSFVTLGSDEADCIRRADAFRADCVRAGIASADAPEQAA
ncbi:MAG: hypothetical protein ACK4FJ_07445 [Ferrovibrio sp.]|uniref:hypothetical protein n=1 Tax=Ferrovibrio sp. TaxID=1917215 RepID=UPI0039195440